jgi:hypothetical protein
MNIRCRTQSLCITAGLLFLLLCLTATGCRATEPAPAATIELTAMAVAVSRLPTTRLQNDLMRPVATLGTGQSSYG